ncbi:hypothetical protein D918_08635 [Trichuris suis]|nr:hypothetical protein D918_08635 [Trichuris suis]
MLHADFVKRFNDILSVEIPDWAVTDPFFNVEEAGTELQEDLGELQNNEESKPKFMSGSLVLVTATNSTTSFSVMGCCGKAYRFSIVILS